MSGIQTLAEGATQCATQAGGTSWFDKDGWIAFCLFGIAVLIKHNHHHDRGEIRPSKRKAFAILGSRKAVVVYSVGLAVLLAAQVVGHGGVGAVMPSA